MKGPGRAPLGQRFCAAHYLLSYQRSTTGRTLRAELYYKDYQNLGRFDGANPLLASAYANTGRGYARGLDVFWRDRYQTFRKTDYWVSYGLLDTRRQFRADLAPAVPTFAATHNLSLVGKYWVEKQHLLLSGTYSYGSPRAYQDPNQPGYNQGRTPSFRQLDLSLSYLPHLAGQFTVVHLAVTNVLGRDNRYRYAAALRRNASGGFSAVSGGTSGASATNTWEPYPPPAPLTHPFTPTTFIPPPTS